MAKSNPTKWILFTLAGIIGVSWLVQQFNQRLQFGTIKMKVRGFTTDLELLLTITIPIINQNNVSINVQDFDGSLWYGPVQIATIDQRQPIVLAGSSTTNYVVEADINLQQLPKDVKEQLAGGNYLQAFFLKGKMRVGSINIPINEQITVLF